MKINCYFETGQTDHGVICALQQTVKNLINKYPEIEFEIVDNQIKKQQGNYPNPFSKYGAYYLIIENPATHKYILVSYGDKLVDIARTEWDLENCVEIFSSIGYHENDVEYKKQTVIKATPISYVGGSAQNEKMLCELYAKRIESGSPRIYPQKPAFRGQLYLFRRHLFDDERFEIKGEFYKLNEKGEVVPGETSRLPPKEYLEELDSRALNLSLNGTGEICFRDMEILGLGTALFRPKLVTELRNKLVPDYHYISVEIGRAHV